MSANAIAPESAAFMALRRLHQVGGATDSFALYGAVPKNLQSRQKFLNAVVMPLVRECMVEVGENTLTITKRGKEHVKRVADGIVPGSGKALNIAKHFAYVEMRPGAHDYRKYPSLMGDTRVPYKGGSGQ